MKAFSPERRALRLIGALAVLFLAAQVNTAQAVTVGPGSVLPNAISFEYFGLNFAINTQTSDTIGTLDYSGQPGCGGICKATTQLGSSPSVFATVNEVEYRGTSGGIVQAKLGYYVAYLNSTPGTYDVNLHATHALSAPDGARVSAGLAFGRADRNFGNFDNFFSKTFAEGACLNGCPGGVSIPTNPFIDNNLIQMEANTLYFIQLDLVLNPGPSNVDISAMIDPTFSTSALGGKFIFSPGVVSQVPLPAALPLFASGLGALGVFGWRRKAKAASSAASADR